MDIKKKLKEQIKNCRRKMNLAKYIDLAVCFAAAGGILGLLCELFSLCRPFYYAHLAAGLCFAAGLLTGCCVGVYKRADMKQAALRLDSFGMKERMITAWEQMEKETEFAKRQRQDALFHYEQQKDRIKIPLLTDKKHMLALFLSAAVVVGVGFIPSLAREQAKLHHQVQEQAKEEKEELSELLEALEGVDMDSLTEEQRQQLKELSEAMQLSKEELSGADSWESLGAAMERLNYKYEQAGQSLGKLASQLDNPEAAGVASAEALAKAMSGGNGQQTASAGTPSAGNGSSSGDSDSDGEGGDGSGENGGSGNGEGDGKESGENAGNGSGSENGNQSGSGNGNGDGNGNGNGSGGGEGEGSGNGGNGNGTGGGRGTGSSSAVHDYVSIPNDTAQDGALTGEKSGDQNSDYYRRQNGLAWEGEHVDYNSVIGKYADNAYEGITKGRYPSGMEPVIRDYFENLNK